MVMEEITTGEHFRVNEKIQKMKAVVENSFSGGGTFPRYATANIETKLKLKTTYNLKLCVGQQKAYTLKYFEWYLRRNTEKNYFCLKDFNISLITFTLTNRHDV